MIVWVKDRDHLTDIRAKHKDYFVLVFCGSFSDASGRALNELRHFSDDHKKIPLCVVDVQTVKNVHKEYSVTNVPTVVVVKHGEEHDRIEGVQSAAYYAMCLGGAAPTHIARPTKKRLFSRTSPKTHDVSMFSA